MPPSPAEHGARPPFGDPTPGGDALDGAPPALAASRASLRDRRRRAPPSGGAALSRRFQPRRGPAIRPLTLPVAPRPPPGKPNVRARSQDRFHRSLVKESRFSRPEAPSLDKCSLNRPLARSAPAHADRSPPPFSRLCHRRAGFRRLFAPFNALARGARPCAIAQALHLWSRGPRAACRLLQSSAIREHNLRDPPSPARGLRGYPQSPLVRRWPSSFRSTASRGFMGQGPAQPRPVPASPAAIAHGGSLSPT